MRWSAPTRLAALLALLAVTAAAQPATFKSNFGGLVVRNAEFVEDPQPLELLVVALDRTGGGKCGPTAETFVMHDGQAGVQTFRKEAAARGVKYTKVFANGGERAGVNLSVEVFTLSAPQLRVHGISATMQRGSEQLTFMSLCSAG